MGLFVFGINHKSCPIEVREKIAFRQDSVAQILSWAEEHLDLEELMILSTCNRVELYGHTPAEAFPSKEIAKLIEHAQKIHEDLYAPYTIRLEGKDMIRHLFRVASGLDSLVVGENEILGQMREAFRIANGAGTVHSLLYRASEKAFKIGKEVRSQTQINEGAVSIPAVAVELAEKIFGRLKDEQVMVLGAGEMSLLTLKNLREAGAGPGCVVSRDAAQGEKLAQEFGGRRISFEAWPGELSKIDIMIASTAAPHPIVSVSQIREAMKPRKGRPLFIIDIAVPRNVEPEVDEIPDVFLYNIDDLRGVSEANTKHRMRSVRAAEEMIEKAVLEYQSWMEQLTARPVMERFERFVDEVLAQELGRLKGNTGLTEETEAELRRRIRAKLLHPPFEKIKEASQNGGVSRYLQALHALFDLSRESRSK